MYHLFTVPNGAPRWPLWVRIVATALIVLATALLKLWLWPHLRGYAFLLFFAAIITSSVLLGRGGGFAAVGLSAIATAYLFLDPPNSIWISRSEDLLAWVLFIIVGLAIATAVGAMHSAVLKLNEVVRHLHTANLELAKADRDKDLLMQEAAHRMRNDLQMLGSLVKLQERAVADPSARSALGATAERIHLLSRVQDRLRRVNDASVVDSHGFIVDLCEDLRTALLDLRPITLKLEVETHDLTQNRAVAVGLIINELLTNALKYAFPDEQPGTVEVRFIRLDDTFLLTVKDDGVGLNPQRGPATGVGGTGLGQRLVKAMAAQLGGAHSVGADGGNPGTLVTVRFPVEG